MLNAYPGSLIANPDTLKTALIYICLGEYTTGAHRQHIFVTYLFGCQAKLLIGYLSYGFIAPPLIE